MYWNEDDEPDAVNPSHETIDFVFQLIGSTLPQEYIGAFAKSLQDQTQWWNENENLSFHMHIAGEEGNGWFRGNTPETVIYISRRNMLVIRAPKNLAEQVEQLAGIELDLAHHKVKLKHKHNKEIKPAPTLYSRFVVSAEQEEGEFLDYVVQYLKEIDVNCKKLLCGKQRQLAINNTQINTRSLMLEGLAKEDSIILQSRGIGEFQKSGCGVLIPHKSVS